MFYIHRMHSMIDGSKKMRQCPFSALCFVIIISLWCTGEPIKMIKMQLGYKSLLVNMHQNRGQSSMDTKMEDDAVTVWRWYTCCWCCCCRCCDVVMFIVGKSKANDWKVVGNKYYLMFIYLVCRHRWYTSCGRCWCCPRLRGWNQSAGIRNSIFLTSLTWSNRFKTIFSLINQIFLREVQIFSGHLICSETVACVLLDTRHKLWPGLREQDAENMKHK